MGASAQRELREFEPRVDLSMGSLDHPPTHL